MDIFEKARVVRLKSRHGKYLQAAEDRQLISQDRDGTSEAVRWTVEILPKSKYLRLKSYYGKYLTASNQSFLLGMTGQKVLQTVTRPLDSSVEWNPVREGNGMMIKLKTVRDTFLRANGVVPPWRNSITHDVPHRSATQDWILWKVDVLLVDHSPRQTPVPRSSPVDSLESDPLSFTDLSLRSDGFSRQESMDSDLDSPPKSEGRTIYYHIAGEAADDEDMIEPFSLNFKGNSVEELTQKLKELTGIDDIVVCSRSPLNRELHPLRLHLPPSAGCMHVVVVPRHCDLPRYQLDCN